MTLVRRASPLGELVSLRHAMDRLFEDSFVGSPSWAIGGSDGFGFPIDVTNGQDSILIEASLPGFKPEDVEITAENGTLSIRAESHSQEMERHGQTVMQEIRRGSVSRTLALPAGLEPDKATATFEHGVLKLRIPKAEAVKPRQIRITPTTQELGSNGANGKGRVAADEATTETARTGA